MGEAGRLLGVGEVVGDEKVVSVIREPHHALPGTAVLGSQRLESVVDLAPCGVVPDLVLDDECGAHVGLLPNTEATCPPFVSTVKPPLFPSQDIRLGNKYLNSESYLVAQGRSGPDST